MTKIHEDVKRDTCLSADEHPFKIGKGWMRISDDFSPAFSLCSLALAAPHAGENDAHSLVLAR